MQTDISRLHPRGFTFGTFGMLMGYATMVIGVVSMGVGGFVLLRASMSDQAAQVAEADSPDAAPAAAPEAAPADTGEAPPADDAGAEIGAPDHEDTGDAVGAAEFEGHEFLIRTIPQQLRYDITSITVKAGSQVRITFENNDIMEHNLLVIEPGTQDHIGNAAMAMMSDPANAVAKGYVPDDPAVLHATRMLKAGEIEVLEFTAPETPDTYHFICTFPGHAMLMRGNMIVE